MKITSIVIEPTKVSQFDWGWYFPVVTNESDIILGVRCTLYNADTRFVVDTLESELRFGNERLNRRVFIARAGWSLPTRSGLLVPIGRLDMDDAGPDLQRGVAYAFADGA